MNTVDLPVKYDEQAHHLMLGTPFAAGIDIAAMGDYEIHPGVISTIHTGIRVEIPDGYFGMLCPRSSTFAKVGIELANTIGIIDSDYRGELMLKVRQVTNHDTHMIKVSNGTRLAQLILIPYATPNILPVNELSDTHRGEGGFGSTS